MNPTFNVSDAKMSNRRHDSLSPPAGNSLTVGFDFVVAMMLMLLTTVISQTPQAIYDKYDKIDTPLPCWQKAVLYYPRTQKGVCDQFCFCSIT
jgi:hypothetical protein